MDLMKTGKFIAALRKEKGLTQEQLGDKIGVTNKTVSRWETVDSQIAVTTNSMLKVCRKL